MIKKIRNYILSDDRILEERHFVLTGAMVCLAIIAVLSSILTSRQSVPLALGLVGTLIFISVVIWITARAKRFVLGGSIIVLMANLVIIPIGYHLGGGVHSGAPIWLVIGIVVVFVLFRGRLQFAYLMVTLIAFATTVYLGERYPGWTVPLQDGYSEATDSFVSVVIVSLTIGILFLFQSRVLEGELKKTEVQKDEIEKLNRMQNSFFASMSHEIRTPITTIIGLNEMTMREKQLPEEILENTLNTQDASKMLLSLINDILDMSKIQSGNMEIVPGEYDTGKMLSEITNLHWNRAVEKGLYFDVQVDESIPPILYGDETRVKQIIINLLSNAIKYTEEGSVTIRFSGEDKGDDKFILIVEIEDTGIGIRRENMQYLFDAFRRVDERGNRNVEGTGLGLSIAKQLVDLMGGTISVNSIYTKGSTFRVEIPQKIVAKSGGTVHLPGTDRRRRAEYRQAFEAPEARVLVVDDNDLNRVVCSKLLRSTQVQVDLAESGAECLEKVRDRHYDVILMDHEMPQMDGIETLHRVRSMDESLCRDTPVIALTANAGSDREAFYLEKGFSAYLSKPIQSSQLESLLLAFLPQDLIVTNNVENEGEAVQVYKTVQKLPFLITTDSICDLPEEILAENEIKVMPYYIVTEAGRFRDIREIDSDNLQKEVNKKEYTVYSDPAPVEEYEDFFGEALTEARIVLHLSSCRNVSRAYDNAFEAAKSFGNVHVIDSGQISMGLGMMAIEAAHMLRRGLTLEEVLVELKKYQGRVRLNYLVPHLEKSRTKLNYGFVLRVLMNVFNVDPVLTTKNGKLRSHGDVHLKR